MTKHFSGNRITCGCALYLAVAMGVIGIYITSIAYLPEAYGISLTELGALGVIMPVSCTVASLGLTSVRRFLSSKGCLILGSAVVIAQAFVLRLCPGKLYALVFTLFTGGLISGLAAHTVVSDIVSHWYTAKRAERIALVLGAAPFGSALSQFAAGHVLERFDFFTGAFMLYLTVGVLMLLFVVILISSSTPERIGQRPFGEEESPRQTIKTAEVQSDRPPLYRAAAFWCLIAATLLSAGNTAYIQSYATTYFMQEGMRISSAASVLSAASICSGLFLLISGKTLNYLRPRRFLMLLVAAVVVANLSMILYGATHSVLAVVPVVIGSGIGGMIPSVGNLICGPFFGQRDATNAASKCYAAYSGANMALQPICAAIADGYGFSVMYVFVAGLCALSSVFYFLASSRASVS